MVRERRSRPPAEGVSLTTAVRASHDSPARRSVVGHGIADAMSRMLKAADRKSSNRKTKRSAEASR
jgi:hypothetical protein